MRQLTTEEYIHAIAAMVRERASEEDREALDHIKLAYGSGPAGTRGVTFFKAWQNGQPDAIPFVEICAFGQEGPTQIAGTTIHELAHVVAGYKAGHGKVWKQSCERLGLRRCKAAGTRYHMSMFEQSLRHQIVALGTPTDGQPKDLATLLGRPVKPKPCGAGIGTRGGKSRGTGSGSRLLKVECCDCGYTARVSAKWLAVGAPHCPTHGEMQAV